MTQNERLSSLAKFKSDIVSILVCTDVASRGLDIPSVQVVINYDLTASAKDYVHRIGRTARAGRKGTAISFVTEVDIDVVHSIEEKTGKKMVEFETQEKVVLEIMMPVNKAKRLAEEELLERDFGAGKRIQKLKRSDGTQKRRVKGL